jgi:hypothetical protein
LNFGGILGLSLAVMYEQSIGEKSPWYKYFLCIPQFEYVPLFWTAEELATLRGTDVSKALDEDRQLLVDDYNEHIFPILNSAKYPLLNSDFMSLERWMHVASIVSSRAFQVDDWHGECLVPLADFFNHKTDSEHVHFESFSDVCPECGSSNDCACFADDFDENDPPQLEEEEEMVKEADEESEDNILEMVVVKDCKSGEEVFNTYGPHSNASLLRLYGFVDSNNKYSSIRITREEILKEIEIISMKSLNDRIAFWDEAGKNMVEDIDMIANSDDEESIDDYPDSEMEAVESQFDDCEESDFEDVTPDDFFIESDGTASFALTAFMNLILMGNELYKNISTDLDSAIEMLTKIKGIMRNDPKGKVKLGSLDTSIRSILEKVVQKRLAGYDESYVSSSKASYYACLLKEEEQSILRKFLGNK